MNNEQSVQPIELSIWDIYGPARTNEALVLLAILILLFLVACVAHYKRKKITALLWTTGGMSVLMYLHGIWRFGNENYKFHEMFAMTEGNMGMSQQAYHSFQLEVYTPLIVSSGLSAIGVLFSVILGILHSLNNTRESKFQPVGAGQPDNPPVKL